MEWGSNLDSRVERNANGLKVTANGTDNIFCGLKTNLSKGKKYGMLLNILENTITSTYGTYFDYVGSPLPEYFILSGKTGNQKYVFNADDDANNVILVVRDLAGSNNYIKMKDVRIFELPSDSQIESDFLNLNADDLAINYPWIDGNKSTTNIRIKSTGQNLFDYTKTEFGSINWSTGENGDDSPTNRRTSGYIAARNSIYAGIGVQGVVDERIYEYDENKKFIRLQYIPNINTAVTLDKRTCFIRVYWGDMEEINLDSLKNVFISQGSTVTTYKPYQESAVYIGQEIRSLPNGVKDEIDISTGNFIKRIEKVTMDGSKVWQLFNNTTSGYKSVITPFTSFPGCISGIGNTFDASTVIKDNGLLLKKTTNANPPENANMVFHDLNNIVLSVPNIDSGWADGYAPSAQDIKNYFDSHPYTLIYQLSQPQYFKLNISSISCYQNGTIAVESVVKNTFTYTSGGISIPNKRLPIRFIESVYKMNDNIMTPIDLNKVHISSNGLSFTIDGAKAGEIYEYIYQYDRSLTTLPTIKYAVPTDQAAQINGNTDMINKLIKEIEVLREELNTIKSDRLVQYEYDANGRLIRKQKL